MEWLERLTEAGFRPVGAWRGDASSAVCNLVSCQSASNVLYAFVSDGAVLYIGKTTMPLSKRMYGYQNPGPTQRTNIANNRRIRQMLEQGRRIDIYALLDDANLDYHGFRVNLAAGLEDTLIAALAPPWNMNGR